MAVFEKKDHYPTSDNSEGISNTPPLDRLSEELPNENEKVTACFDWFRFQFDDCRYSEYGTDFLDKSSREIINELLNILGCPKKENEIGRDNCGRNGYPFMLCVFDGVEIWLNGPLSGRNMPTTILEIQGHACSRIDKIKDGWLNIFLWCFKRQGRPTRLDTAIDDRIGIMKKDEVDYRARKKLYTSIFKGLPNWIGSKVDDVWKGLTIYWGDKANGLELRYYDKNEERLAKDKNYIPLTEFWFRWEMQLSDTRAFQIMKLYVSSLLKRDITEFTNFVRGLLSYIITFREESNLENKSEWPIAKNWALLLDYVNKIQTTGAPKSKGTIESKIDWVKRSVFGCLASLYAVADKDDFLDFIMRGIALKLPTLSNKDIVAINETRLDIGKEEWDTDVLVYIGYKLLDTYRDHDGLFQIQKEESITVVEKKHMRNN